MIVVSLDRILAMEVHAPTTMMPRLVVLVGDVVDGPA
jgi:hypothetical protein